ncbi:uncharacterized protein LOC129944412 [Eupeodes corollae]|uniref:uncharacterized protein LOC129944412 n=1 Tax=Eupeodes corollae TaxID=290404 RepID=UPI0024932072|nr:uncharacterized protein LOC129944412 [Eupeodes corollae]
METEIDNIIYTDINDIHHYKNQNAFKSRNKISNENNLNLINGFDIYATVNRKAKSKSKINHISNEFFDKSIKKRNSLKYVVNSNKMCVSFPDSCVFEKNLKKNDYNDVTHSENCILPFDNLNINLKTPPLSKKLDYSFDNSVHSYEAHESNLTIQTSKHQNSIMYVNDKNLLEETGERLFESSIDLRLSSAKLENELSNIDLYSEAQYKQHKETNTDVYMEKESWLKSSSCRDLLRENEESKPITTFVKGFLSFNRLESPITRYDDSGHFIYLNKNQSHNTFQHISTHMNYKIYSSSYPGSTRSNFAQHKRMYGNQIECSGSQDDISHDSYELLEKSNHELFDKFTRSDHNIRSYSIDSGNFISSDDEIASGNQKYRSAMDVKCKSVADIMNEIWDSGDPRYFPREKLCVKSDGSFYKKVREIQDTQSSSQESRSDIYETKPSRDSYCSKKSRDSLYNTDSKKSRETTRSKSSLISSVASKESLIEDSLIGNYEMPKTTGKKVRKDLGNYHYKANSSVESKSDNYDAPPDFLQSQSLNKWSKGKSIGCLLLDKHCSLLNGFLCENCDTNPAFNKYNQTSKVQSISLQNVEIEKISKSLGKKSSENISSNKNQEVEMATNSLRSMSIYDDQYVQHHHKKCQVNVAIRRKSDSENIFSFDQDKIESFTSCDKEDEQSNCDNKNENRQDYPLTPELLSEFDKQLKTPKLERITRKEELMAKTHFEEYNPKVKSNQSRQLTNVLVPLTHSHVTVERTKSDPNSLANRSGSCKNQRRHILMHQKSIDLTPADSSDEDYFYKQIPSAPPQYKAFGNFEVPKTNTMIASLVDIKNTEFEILKNSFHEIEFCASKVLKEEIPYVLHKRHVINGTSSSPNEKKFQKPRSPKSPKSPKSLIVSSTNSKSYSNILPDILDSVLPVRKEELLFSQNVDFSNIDYIKQKEDDRSFATSDLLSLNSCKVKDMDKRLLEKLNKKINRIESDSTANYKNETPHKEHQDRLSEQKQFELCQNSTKFSSSKKIISKTRALNKVKKNKTRITSFSSDDESLDSDDVFGSAEPIPSTLEFSPPQSRKEIEPILQIEQNKLISAAWGRGQTMSSTEIEGSPPQCRRLPELDSRYDNIKLDSNVLFNGKELRRISERSISIPSSEEENYISSKDICDHQQNEKNSFPIILNSDLVHSEESKNEITKANTYVFKKNDSQQSSQIVKLDPPAVNSRKPILLSREFNLSEGSATLQEKMPSLKTPLKIRRTKSLEISMLAMHNLPQLNAYSSKDDTIEFQEEADVLEEKVLQVQQKINNTEGEMLDSVRSCAGSIPSAQICHSSLKPETTIVAVNIDLEESNLLHQLAFIEKITLKGVKIKDRHTSKMELRSGDHLILDIPKYNFDYSPLNSCTSSRKTSPGVSRASSLESTGLRKSKMKAKNSDLTKLKLNVENAFSTKKDKGRISKDNQKLIEKERKSSREKTKMLEETEANIAKRKERQQKLYESAIKQTITMLSPVMDKLPPFPTPEDKISVKTEGDKIIIETEFKSKAKDHVLIAKSPRKLDSSLIKFSRSFDEGCIIKKLEKANRSFEDRKKSFEDSEKSETTSDVAVESPKTTNKSHSFEESEVHNKDRIFSNLETKFASKTALPNVHTNNAKRSFRAESWVRPKENNEKVRSVVADRRIFANHSYLNEEIDTQAVISERRSLEILKRQYPKSEDTGRDSDGSHMPSTGDSIDSYVSVDESTSDSKPSFTAEENAYRVPTIECEEASLDDPENLNESRHLKVSQSSNYYLSLDRSDETGSWMTVECEEYIGSDTSENDPRTLEPNGDSLVKQTTLDDAADLNIISASTSFPDQNVQIILTDIDQLFSTHSPNESIGPNVKHIQTIGQQNDKSENFDICAKEEFGGERCDWSPSFSSKEKSSVEDESSVSCSIARPLGISQDFGDVENKKCLELKEQMLKTNFEKPIETKNLSNPNKKSITPVLEKQRPVDFGSSTETFQDDLEKNQAQSFFKDEDSPSVNIFAKFPCMCEPGKKKNSRNPRLNSVNTVDNCQKSGSDQSSQESKSSFDSKTSLSIESKGSFETESSSGSLGLAQRHGLLLQKEQQSTWKPFTMESSGSSSIEEKYQDNNPGSFQSIDHVIALNDSSENDFKELLLRGQKVSDIQCKDELIDLSTTIGYPVLTSTLSGIGTNTTDIIGYSTGFATGRTLSRISERSTASEKSSIEDDVSKASTHSVSMRDESAGSTDHQASLSSDSRSNTNIAYISDAERRTSAEMPDIPCDSGTGERLSCMSSLIDNKSSTVITGRFAVTQVEEKTPEEFDRHTLLCLSNPGSQDSEDWPLPEIPYDFVPVKSAELIFLVPDLDKSVPNTFCWKSTSLHPQDGRDWHTPLFNSQGFSSTEKLEPFQSPACISSPETTVDFIDTTKYTLEDIQYTQTPKTCLSSPEETKILPYADTSYFMSSFFNNNSEVDDACFSKEDLTPPNCLNSVSFLPYSFKDKCCTVLKSFSDNSLIKENVSNGVIILQPTLSPRNLSPLSVQDTISNNDVFLSGAAKTKLSPQLSRKHTCSSNNSDTSADDIASLSGLTLQEDQITIHRGLDKLVNSNCHRKCSHSSHSEEETSSMGTDLDGTVRIGLQLKNCTHSSHSEDTSIGLSISEWSTGTNTVHQYANLSGSDSLSAVSNHSCGVKSEKSNHTKSSVSSFNKSSESLRGKTSHFSGSKQLSVEISSSDGILYDILSSSETDKLSDSVSKSNESTPTLTEMAAKTVTKWPESSSRTLITSQPQISKTKNGRCKEYIPLKNGRDVKNVDLIKDKKCIYPLKSNTKNYSNIESNQHGYENVFLNNIPNKSSRENDKLFSETHLDISGINSASKKLHSLEVMSKRYQSAEVLSDAEMFIEYLYPPSEKLSALYQSQEFAPLQPTSIDSRNNSETFSLPLLEYEDKKNSANEKEECQLQKSHSFQEAVASEKSLISGKNRDTTLANKRTTFTDSMELKIENFSPKQHNIVDKTYNSLPLSGKDADNLYHKKYPTVKNNMRSYRFQKEKDNMTFDELEIPKSCKSQYGQSEEEKKLELSDCYDHHTCTEFCDGNICGTELPSNTGNEMGFQQFDRLQQFTFRISPKSSNSAETFTNKKPIKPTRHKKRQLICDESVDTEHKILQHMEKKSIFDQKQRLCVCISNEKSVQKLADNELPCPDFLSDYENDRARDDIPQHFSA